MNYITIHVLLSIQIVTDNSVQNIDFSLPLSINSIANVMLFSVMMLDMLNSQFERIHYDSYGALTVHRDNTGNTLSSLSSRRYLLEPLLYL